MNRDFDVYDGDRGNVTFLVLLPALPALVVRRRGQCAPVVPEGRGDNHVSRLCGGGGQLARRVSDGDRRSVRLLLGPCDLRQDDRLQAENLYYRL